MAETLFMKVARMPTGRTFAWTSLNGRTLTPGNYLMSAAESGEFTYLRNHDKVEGLGAGGQYIYRVYDLVEPPKWPYAIVYPPSKVVREQYPEACRVVNMQTGAESALTDNLTHARNIIDLARAKKLKGSFA